MMDLGFRVYGVSYLILITVSSLSIFSVFSLNSVGIKEVKTAQERKKGRIWFSL